MLLIEVAVWYVCYCTAGKLGRYCRTIQLVLVSCTVRWSSILLVLIFSFAVTMLLL